MKALIHKPSNDRIISIQETQNSIYWNSCAELILKKHGLNCVYEDQYHEPMSDKSCYNICLRGSNVQSCEGFFEGPIDELSLEKFGISVEQKE